MKRMGVFFIAVLGVVAVSGAAQAGCFPVKTDIVSLGEKAARFYAQRSLDKNVDEQKSAMESTGAQIGKVTKAPLDCKHFPNVLGADEWRCTGEAKVCTKI